MSTARPLRKCSPLPRWDGGRCGGMPCGLPTGRRRLRIQPQTDTVHSAMPQGEGAA